VIQVEPVRRVVGGRADPDDDNWGAARSVIRLDAERFGVVTEFGPRGSVRQPAWPVELMERYY
jgi:hypothetical protein